MLRIVTDGTVDMPPTWKDEYVIEVVPVNIHLGDKTYLSNVDLDNEGFYRLVEQTGKIPKTSQPSPHQFIERYKAIAKPGETILSIHVTSKLSGTFASAVAAARELEGLLKVIPFDSMIGSAGIGILCREARLLERAGKAVDEILKHLEALRSRQGLVLALDTLEYARMSGRVGMLQAAIASMLNVKPIAMLREGALHITEKVRTRKASLERLVEIVKEEVGQREVMLAVVHARDLQAGQSLMERAQKMFKLRDIFLTDLSFSVVANLGPGTVGIVFFPME